MNKRTEYRTVKVDCFKDEASGAWFWAVPFEWVIYRSNRGYAIYSDAREAAEDRIDQLLNHREVVK